MQRSARNGLTQARESAALTGEAVPHRLKLPQSAGNAGSDQRSGSSVVRFRLGHQATGGNKAVNHRRQPAFERTQGRPYGLQDEPVPAGKRRASPFILAA